MMFEAGIILGASSEAMSYLNSSAIELGWPYLQLEQTVSLFSFINIVKTHLTHLFYFEHKNEQNYIIICIKHLMYS